MVDECWLCEGERFIDDLDNEGAVVKCPECYPEGDADENCRDNSTS